MMDNTANLYLCDICGGSDKGIIGSPRIDEKNRSIRGIDQVCVVKCKNCGFYYTHPRIYLANEQASSLYDSQYFGEMPNWWRKRRVLDRKERFDNLQKIALKRIENFLDIGCGEGYTLQEATK